VNLVLGKDTTESHLDYSDAGTTTVAVPAYSLSEILDHYHIGDYSLVCDIEGAEAGFINGDDRSLDRCMQMIIELHETTWAGQHVSVAEMKADILERHHFRLEAQHGAVFVFSRHPKNAD
jgi:hypothetical protein